MIGSRIAIRQLWVMILVAALVLSLVQGMGVGVQTASAAVSSKTIVGYWHNFDNGSGFIKLRDVSPKFDVINVSFAEPTSGVTNGTIGFTPYNYTEAEFKADVAYLQGQGKKVIISIGGQNGQVQLASTTARDNFVQSVTAIIEKYGFDGLDVDFEGHSLYLNTGDSDFKNPTTPVIVNLIAALRSINNHFGTNNFYLTMAPETFFVQLGYSFYGGSCISCDSRAGAYLPVIYATRDILDWLQVQNYNSGPIIGLDDQYHTMGNADFHVAMADMLLTGFPVAKNANHIFPALRPDQVLLGLPANANAGGGFTTVTEVHKALNAIMKGIQLPSYQMRSSTSGFADFRGVMTWSINWDKFNNFEFSNSHRAYLDAITPPVPDTQPPTAPANVTVTSKSSTSVSLSWTASTDNVGVTGYTVSYGNQSVESTSTNVMINNLTPDTTYVFTVSAKDAKGNQSAASAPLTVKTDPSNSGQDTIPPSSPSNVQVVSKSASSVTLNWNASTDNVGVVGYTIAYGSAMIQVLTTQATISALTPNTSYTFTITAKDAAGNTSTAASISVTTDAQAGAQAWAPNVSYKVNDEVSYSGNTYVCRQPHTSLQGWEPPNVPALWLLKP
ncbi:fibronectin type III domain-containing protein [Paenibacillus aquistagni]|uniref:fibronectin type III domain-containing protein n=1 Tax=Paenibacillus aquistagni TaxID=1852522 RepID=UPI00145AFC34|nr:glycosyl hydrolase family 18 protein [Paenibacillus aquistagni]NMM52781.1 chitinase [Paenibacillus aquistagni]